MSIYMRRRVTASVAVELGGDETAGDALERLLTELRQVRVRTQAGAQVSLEIISASLTAAEPASRQRPI